LNRHEYWRAPLCRRPGCDGAQPSICLFFVPERPGLDQGSRSLEIQHPDIRGGFLRPAFPLDMAAHWESLAGFEDEEQIQDLPTDDQPERESSIMPPCV